MLTRKISRTSHHHSEVDPLCPNRKNLNNPYDHAFATPPRTVCAMQQKRKDVTYSNSFIAKSLNLTHVSNMGHWELMADEYVLYSPRVER